MDHFYFSIAYNSIGSILQGKAFKVVQKESRNLYKALRKDELERMKIRFKKKILQGPKDLYYLNFYNNHIIPLYARFNYFISWISDWFPYCSQKNMAEIKKTQLYSETILYRMGHTYFWFEFTFKILMVIKKYVYIKSIYVLRFRRYSDNKRFI